MKAIVCEMCGSQDLIKQDGMFVCQNCGTKYDPEEAKKLLIEIKVDESEKLKNLFIAARQARDSNDAENAAKYYGLIAQEDPNSWEAVFYNVYFRAMQTKIMFIESAATSVRQCLATVFRLIDEHLEDTQTKKVSITEVALRVSIICSLLESNAKSTFKTSYENTIGKYDGAGKDCMNYFHEYHKRLIAVCETFFTLGDVIEHYYSDDSEIMQLATTAWKTGLQYWANDYRVFDHRESNKAIIDNDIGDKIRKYEPAYVFPTPNYDGFPVLFLRTFDSGVNGSGGGGCYIATAVYGSYDCPQVWTLRRFRDYTLAETWCGRTFINIYYTVSPTLVKWFGKTKWFKSMFKPKLDNLVNRLNAAGISDTPYADRKW